MIEAAQVESRVAGAFGGGVELVWDLRAGRSGRSGDRQRRLGLALPRRRRLAAMVAAAALVVGLSGGAGAARAGATPGPGETPAGPRLEERQRGPKGGDRATRSLVREETALRLSPDALRAPAASAETGRKRRPARGVQGTPVPDPSAASTPKALLHLQDFEDAFPSAGWQAFDNNGYAGGEVYWDDADYRSYEGNWAAWCADGGDDRRFPWDGYRSNMDAWMIYGPFDLSAANAGALTFYYWLDSEKDFDFFNYLVSIDGDDFFGYRTSGRTGGWDYDGIDFTDVPELGDVTGYPQVWIAFSFSSDERLVGEGAYVDDVWIEASASGAADLAIELLDVGNGTYEPGDELVVTNRVRNVGSAASPPYLLSFWASADATIGSDDVALGYVERDGLAVGAAHEYDTTPLLPDNLPAGTWYIGALLETPDANAGNDVRVDPTPITVRGPSPGVCVPGAATMCLLSGRYRVQATWSNPYEPGRGGQALALPQTDFAGYFAFDDRTNVELMVKILDFGGAVKVFYSQLTDLDFTLTVTDTRSGRSKQYRNTAGECGAIDQSFFAGAGIELAMPKLAPQEVAAAASCVADNDTLCLLDRRFALEVHWFNPHNNSGGDGQAAPLSGLTGQFWFSDPRNVELLTKVLDFGDRILFFYGALSDFEYEIVVTDTVTGRTKVFFNPAGRYCGGADTRF